ncbi:MAG: hypothetical protein IT365_21610 [Candidatus Hydrogenedentes bacterium]|nr:hypothetical protein [Candidatus Hydrogenedentota bacterium]
MRDTIETIRAQFGKVPRSFGFLARRYVRIKPPNWMDSDDDLMEIYRQQDLLIREGEIVWAAVVQANELLFDKGPEDHPAMVVYCPDRSVDSRPEWLGELASYLFDLKNTTPQDAGERQLADMITDELERGLGWTVPASITGGMVVRSTSVMVIRRHLPGGVLAETFLPLLIHPDTVATMIVPYKYWPGRADARSESRN